MSLFGLFDDDSALKSAVAALQQQVFILQQKEQQNMSTLNDAISKLAADIAANKTATDSLASQLTAASTNITHALNDLKAAINSQPDSAALLAQVTPLLATLEANTASVTASASSLQSLSNTASTADPGAPVTAPVNS